MWGPRNSREEGECVGRRCGQAGDCGGAQTRTVPAEVGNGGSLGLLEVRHEEVLLESNHLLPESLVGTEESNGAVTGRAAALTDFWSYCYSIICICAISNSAQGPHLNFKRS